MTIPSQRWFPSSLPARAVWFQNFSEKFSEVGAALGFNAATILGVEQDNQMIQFFNSSSVQVESYRRAFAAYIRLMTEGDAGSQTPTLPANLDFTLPVEGLIGIFERLVKLVDRIRVAPNYTDEIGALLGILPTETGSISPENVKPSIEAFAASGDYEMSVVVSNRLKADSWEVFVLREGQTKWQPVKTATGKSVDVKVSPIVEGKPERIQVRVQLIKNNEDYGQPSDPTYVTLNA